MSGRSDQDPGHTVSSADLNGVEILQWGTHDRVYSLATHLPGNYAGLLAKHGRYPVFSCDTYGVLRGGGERLLRDLLEGVERKRALLLDLLESEDWDLFSCTLSESHCVGHHFWHHLDPSHPEHDPRAPSAMREAIERVYRGLDETVGALIDAAGGSCTTLIVASTAWGRSSAATFCSWRCSFVSEWAPTQGRRGRAWCGDSSTRSRIGYRWNGFPSRNASHGSGHYGAFSSAPDARPFRSSRPVRVPRRSPNNRVGAIRLNLKGREPHGCVAPGRDAEELVRELRGELLALEHPERGEPIVERITTADEAFGADHHPDVPDLLVVFRRDLGPLEACRSPRIGVVRAPVRNARIERTGDHTNQSRLWAVGSGVAAGSAVLQASVLDISPTVLEVLGVAPAGSVDGRALDLRGERRVQSPGGPLPAGALPRQ